MPVDTTPRTTDLELDAAPRITTEGMTASMSAIASARVDGDFDSTASAVGVAAVAGPATAELSAVGIMTAKGDGTVSQSYAGMLATSGTITATQTLAPAVLSRTVTFDQGAAGVVVGGDVNVNRGIIGILLAPRAEVSDDSRILLSGKSLGVLALAVLGGFGLVALGVWLGAERLAKIAPTGKKGKAEQGPFHLASRLKGRSAGRADGQPFHWWNRIG